MSLSEQQLVSCAKKNYGCKGGNVDKAFQYVINNGGIAKEEDYPYKAVNGTCDSNLVCIHGACFFSFTCIFSCLFDLDINF